MAYTKKIDELSGIDQNELWEKILEHHSVASNRFENFAEMAECASEKLKELKKKDEDFCR